MHCRHLKKLAIKSCWKVYEGKGQVTILSFALKFTILKKPATLKRKIHKRVSRNHWQNCTSRSCDTYKSAAVVRGARASVDGCLSGNSQRQNPYLHSVPCISSGNTLWYKLRTFIFKTCSCQCSRDGPPVVPWLVMTKFQETDARLLNCNASYNAQENR